MRVIAGAAKGRRLGPPPPGVRPVADRAREGVFSSLGGRVEGAAVLDLYAGTGAMGIEALSRGAERATFVDRSPASAAAVADNLRRTGLEAAARVVRRDVATFLRGRDVGGPYDLVLADPPYEADVEGLATALAALPAALPEDGWTVVLTRGARSSTVVIPIDWLAARRLAYGDSLVTLYRPARRP